MLEATSPPACPPMPSATTNRLLPAYPESWLLERTLPVCEIATLEPSKTMPTLGAKLERRGPDLDGGADLHGDGLRDALAVVPGSVRRGEVLQHPLLAPQDQAGVLRRGVVVAHHEAGLAGAADRERLVAEGQFEARLRAGRDDDALRRCGGGLVAGLGALRAFAGRGDRSDGGGDAGRGAGRRRRRGLRHLPHAHAEQVGPQRVDDGEHEEP